MITTELSSFYQDFFAKYSQLRQLDDDDTFSTKHLDEFLDPGMLTNDGKRWQLTKGQVTTAQLSALEKRYGFKFPAPYKDFLLTYNHCFFQHLGVNTHKQPASNYLFDIYPNIITAGYLPFGRSEDEYFIYCISRSKNRRTKEYEIVRTDIDSYCKYVETGDEFFFGLDEDDYQEYLDYHEQIDPIKELSYTMEPMAPSWHDFLALLVSGNFSEY